MNLYLCGFQGVGKTYFGKKLAEEIKAPFFDVDEHFLELEGGNLTTVRDLYTTLGKEHFRNKEEKIVQEILKKGPAIVALGGGTLVSKPTQRLVTTTGTLVYLMLPKERLRQKLDICIAERNIPAYLDAKDPIAAFEKNYDERNALFSSLAMKVINIEEYTNTEVLAILKELWEYAKK